LLPGAKLHSMRAFTSGGDLNGVQDRFQTLQSIAASLVSAERRCTNPHVSRFEIFFRADTFFVHRTEHDPSAAMSVLGGSLEQTKGLRGILWDAVASQINVRKIIFGKRVPRVCSFVIPGYGSGLVFFAAQAICVHIGEVSFSIRIVGFSSF